LGRTLLGRSLFSVISNRSKQASWLSFHRYVEQIKTSVLAFFSQVCPLLSSTDAPWIYQSKTASFRSNVL
jgi:hypothetical protein